MLFTVFLAMLAVCLRPCITAQVINRIMPAVLGSSVTLDCTVPRAPGSYLIWEKMDPRKTIAINNKLQSEFVNSNTISVHSRGGNMTSLELTSMSLAENGEYRCYDVGDLATINSFDVSILGKTRIGYVTMQLSVSIISFIYAYFFVSINQSHNESCISEHRIYFEH